MPIGWSSIRLAEAGVWSGGGTPSKHVKAFWEAGDIPWVSPKDMKALRIRTSEDQITQAAVEDSAARRIAGGSVLVVVRSGILQHTLPVAVSDVEVTVNQDLKALTPHEGISAEYVAWALRAGAAEVLRSCKKDGTTVASIDFDALSGYELPLAPETEQRRIVEAVESYLSRLDAAVASLEQAQARLKAYRASVLKAAVEGRLVPTEAELARAEGRDYEPADVLLKRILANRPRRREKAELGSTEVAGKRAKNDGWKAKYQDPASPDTRFLPELPEGWCWATVDQLGDTVTGTTPASESGLRISQAGSQSASALRKTRIPFIKPTDLNAGENVSQARQYLSLDGVEQARLLPAGAVLVTCIGATIGKTGLARVPCATNQQINAWIPAAPVLHTRYGYWFFVGPVGRSQVIEQSSSTTLPILNKSRFRQIPVALPPVAEQERIVSEIERLLSSAQATDRAVRSNLRRLNRFRQAILKAAFEGKLVAQDPTDEPAEKLLERIRSERASSTSAKPRRSRKSQPAR